jgi:hypothetical protein
LMVMACVSNELFSVFDHRLWAQFPHRRNRRIPPPKDAPRRSNDRAQLLLHTYSKSASLFSRTTSQSPLPLFAVGVETLETT